MTGEEVARLSNPNCQPDESAKLIREMQTKTGLELMQILNCIQHCIMGRIH